MDPSGVRWIACMRDKAGGQRRPVVLASLCSLLCTVTLLSGSASAALVHVYKEQINASIAPSGSSFSPQSVAVDNSSSSAKVYVVDGGSPLAVDKFTHGPYSSASAYLCQITGLGSASTSSGECSASSPGPGALSRPFSVAVDQSTGHVYVADGENNAVYRFGALGVYESTISESTVLSSIPKPLGAFEPVSVAIDETTGQIYVADVKNEVVDVFKESLGSYSYDCQITGAGEASTSTSECDTSEPKPGVPAGAFSRPFSVAFDNSTSSSAGELYVTDEEQGVVDKFSSTGVYLSQLTGPEAAGGPKETFAPKFGLGGVAVDQSDGDLYVEDTEKDVVDQFGPAGEYVTQINGSGTPAGSFTPSFVATDRLTGDVYVTDGLGSHSVVDVFGPLVAVPDVTTGPASPITVNSETLSGTVEPEGEAVTDCRFEYGTTTLYDKTALCEQTQAEIGTTGAALVSADISGLQPYTTYHFRLVAANKNDEGTPVDGVDREFTTLSPPIIDDAWAADVTEKTAQLRAQIRPMGSDTSYRFEYGLCSSPSRCPSSYEKSAPIPQGDLGSGSEDVTVGVELSALGPATTYHYRVVVTNARREVVESEDHGLTTQSTGTESSLPDNRAWELVSRPNKHGALIASIGGGLVEAAAEGGALTYVASGTVEEEPQGNRLLAAQVLSRRGSGGWSSQEIVAANPRSTGFAVGGEEYEYKLVSSDLSLGLLEPASANPLLSEEASGWTPYLRQDLVSSQSCQLAPSACWTPLVTSREGYADIQPPGSTFARFKIKGATPDLGHIVLSDEDAALYEWTAAAPPAQRLQPVGVLPHGEGGAMVEHAAELGDSEDFGMGNAVSRDGSRVFWESSGSLQHHLYVRDTTKGETVRLDVVQPGGEEAERAAETPEPAFQAASAGGSRVFFTDEQRLTEGSGNGDLYECEVKANMTTGKLECILGDLTSVGSGKAVGLQGQVLGASEDGSYVYFAANAVLALHATAGACKINPAPQATCSLYVAHESEGTWKITFIATLEAAGGDAQDANPDFSPGRYKTSRVSPDGHWLAFMSDRPLTGYDNRDANSGESDEEVYLYDAEGGGKLVCASCNPTGARPEGEEIEQEGDYVNDEFAGPWHERWVAATVPSLTSVTLTTSSYQSRYLSNGGRLFFDSHAALSPHATNGTWDVYEYEPSTGGETSASDSCTTSAVSYSERSEGCVSLISSGASEQESAFLDASENGDDVFFLTAAKLVPQDYDSAYDVYDAHVCSSESPCVSEPAPTPACMTTDSCREAPAQQPSVFGAPPSATFSGAGNVPPPASKPAAKSLTRAQKLAQALKACRKKKNKRKRATCEKQASKSYGAKASGAKKTRKANASKRGRG